MTDHILAIDAGTTRIRALLVDRDLNVVGRAYAAAHIAHPAPGRVEQDPELLWQAVGSVVDAALASAGANRQVIGCIGVATQRGNVVVWDPATGQAAAPLVSWQDLRGIARAAQLAERGFLVAHQMSAAKLESVLDSIDDGRARLNAGKLLWGNLDTYLAWRLSGGAIYATDHGQACATGYYDYFTGAWNRTLIEAQQLNADRFPSLADSTAHLGATDAAGFGVAAPISAIVADQQGAALAQNCLARGLGKVSYGTSATLDINTGSEMQMAPGSYPMVLWQHHGERAFCVEGMVNTAGAMIDWVIATLGVADSPVALAALAAAETDTAGVYVLPALQGLGAPHGDPRRAAVFGGLTRATSRGHIARAVLEGIAFRVREAMDAIRAGTHLPPMQALRVDGGASRSDILLQIQADVLGMPVERFAIPEATAMGAAIAAGCGTGLWELASAAQRRKVDHVFTPSWSDDEREGRFAQWRDRCAVIGP